MLPIQSEHTALTCSKNMLLLARRFHFSLKSYHQSISICYNVSPQNQATIYVCSFRPPKKCWRNDPQRPDQVEMELEPQAVHLGFDVFFPRKSGSVQMQVEDPWNPLESIGIHWMILESHAFSWDSNDTNDEWRTSRINWSSAGLFLCHLGGRFGWWLLFLSFRETQLCPVDFLTK